MPAPTGPRENYLMIPQKYSFKTKRKGKGIPTRELDFKIKAGTEEKHHHQISEKIARDLPKTIKAHFSQD